MSFPLEKAQFSWDWRWLTTASVFLLFFYVIRFYRKVSKYPEGPFPLPLVGNILSEYFVIIPEQKQMSVDREFLSSLAASAVSVTEDTQRNTFLVTRR